MSGMNPLSSFLFNASVIGRHLNAHQLNINTSLERLSSGLRLNSPADDPVDYTRASQFQTRLLSTRQAQKNTQEGLNLAGTAIDGAHSVLSNLQRVRELIVSSLSDSSSSSDRSNIQNEITSLFTDIDRIVNHTNYNSRQLLDGSSEGFRYFERANYEILSNFTYSSETTGNKFDFLAGVQVDPQTDVNDTILFKTTINSSTNKYTLELRSARQGALAYYDDLDTSPFTFNIAVPTASGSGNVSISRAPYDFERITGPLTSAELNKPLEQLVNDDRLDPISYGTLTLDLGPNTYNLDINGSMSLQTFLNDLNALSSGPNALTATYDTGTGKITLDYTGQAPNTSSNVSSYTIADPAAAGGPYANYASLPNAAQGPAYPVLTLPATGFAISAPPADFPSLPSSLDTSVSYAGSDASITSVFGLSNAGNLGVVTAYSSEFYGETVATSTDSEYVNRTRVVIPDLTAQQNSNGTDTGLSSADTPKTFQVLNTAKVSSASLSSGDFTIDFGANGVFNFSVAPNSTTIQDIVDALNSFNPGNVSASYNDSSDTLSISNTPPSVSQPKVNDPGLVAGTFSIDFGDNGVFATAFDPSTQSIADLVSAVNTFGAGVGGNVSAAYDASSDTLTLNNTATSDNRIAVAADATSDSLRQLFKLSNVGSTGGGLQSISSSADIDNSSISSSLDISDPAAETFDQLTTPIAVPQDNRIEFGGANGTAIASFFKLSDAANNGSGLVQSISSSGAIDNGSLDPSLELTATDRTSTSLQALRSPKLNTLVTGTLSLNGQNIIAIDPNTNTISDVLDAINNFTPSGNRSYSANFDSSIAGGLRITVSDTETLSNAAAQPAANPGAGSPTVTANQLTLDSSAYFATGAPVFEQSSYAATPLTPNAQNTPYVTTAPAAPGNVSGISFSGSTNIASVLFLNNAASGAASVVGDEYQGTATATSHNSYDLTGNQRRTFQASSSTTSTQRLGYDTSAIDESSIPEDGIIGEVRIIPRAVPHSADDSLKVQVGADAGNHIRLDISDLSTQSLRLEGLSIYQSSDSDLQARLRGENALNVIDQAIDKTTSVLSELGGSENILQVQLNGLSAEKLNLTQSLSDIQDADLTTEITNLTKAQINTQVGAAVLAQNGTDTRNLYSLLFGGNGGFFGA